jgi:hypothetical protein
LAQPKYDFVELRPVDLGIARHQRLDRNCAEIVGAHLGERSAEAADRGADGIANENIAHGALLPASRPRFDARIPGELIRHEF